MPLRKNRITYNQFRKLVVKDTPQFAFDYIYRVLSFPLSYLLYILCLTPNQISVLSIVLTILGGICVTMGLPVIGLLILMSGYLFDFCDGNIARIKDSDKHRDQQSKILGAFLENFNTNLMLSIFTIAFTAYFYMNTDNPEVVAVGAGFIFATFIFRYSNLHYQLLTTKAGSESKEPPLFLNEHSWLKGFLSKAVFNINMYYPVLLMFLVFAPTLAPLIFILHITLGGIYTMARFIVLLARIVTK